MRNCFRLLLLIVFCLTLPITVQAQERPLLVLRFEAEHGYTLTDRKAGLSGAVYALAHKDAATGTQTLQIAYDARNRPVLMRLVRVMAQDEDIGVMITSAQRSAALVQPEWDEADRDLPMLLEPQLTTFRRVGKAQDIPIPLPTGKPGSLTFVPDQRLAVLDLPVSTPEARTLGEAEARSLIADTTFLFDSQDGEAAPLRRYHAPNGRIGGGSTTGETRETGSWKVESDGSYCVETAPVAGFRCSVLYRTGPDRHLAVPVIRDAPDGRGMRAFTVAYGNPGAFALPHRNDAVSGAVARMILPGRTEERRDPSGAMEQVFLDPDGSFRGVRGGKPIQGAWSILDDGRRCLIDSSTPKGNCLFLSETDSGTYRFYDADNAFRGEALYRNGNPAGF